VIGEKAKIMNRISIMFGAAAVFAWFGLDGANAQTLERPQVGQKAPQALVPAQPPLLPLPPGFVKRAPSSDTAVSQPQAGSKTITANQASRTNASKTNGTVPEPEQTRVAQVYRGAGYFDAALAEKLKPMLAKALGASKSEQKQLPRMSQSASGNEDSVQSKDEENSRKITLSGGL
jgi:hypothetical protein